MSDVAGMRIRLDTSEVKEGTRDLDALKSRSTPLREEIKLLNTHLAQLNTSFARGGAAPRAFKDALEGNRKAMHTAAISAGQYSNAMRLLPAQITDIVTQLVSGQSAFMIAIQQGGQIRDSFGGISAALKALSSVITPARLALGATAGTAALLAKGFLNAQREGFELSKSIILSGNAAGVTRDALAQMAEGIDDLVGTQASAAATLAQLVGTGRVAAKDLEEFATVAQQLKRTAGQPIEETVKILAELGRRPVEAALKLNESVNFLTASTYRQIRALEEQGRTTEAGEVAQRAYSAAMAERTRQLEGELGTLQRLARGTGETFSEMWSAILNVGRPATIDDQVADIDQRIRELRAGVIRADDDDGFGGFAGNRDREIARLEEERRQILENAKAKEAAAKADAKRKQEVDKLVASEKEAVKVSSAHRALLEEMSKLKFGIDLSAIQRELNASLSGYSAYEAQLEALRDAGLVSEKDYYAARRALIERDSDVRTRALQSEAARVNAEIQRLQQARAQLDRDASGSSPSLTESEQLKAAQRIDRELIAQRERLRDLELELGGIRRDSAAEFVKLATQEARAARVSTQALNDARSAAQSYLDTLRQANDRRLASFGRGDRAREITDSRNDIDDRFASQRLDLGNERSRLQAEGKWSEELQRRYDERLAIIQESNEQALAETDRYWEELTQLQGDFFAGARGGSRRLRR